MQSPAGMHNHIFVVTISMIPILLHRSVISPMVAKFCHQSHAFSYGRLPVAFSATVINSFVIPDKKFLQFVHKGVHRC